MLSDEARLTAPNLVIGEGTPNARGIRTGAVPRTGPAVAAAAPLPADEVATAAAAMVMTKAARENSWQWCVHLDLMERIVAVWRGSTDSMGRKTKGVVADDLT